MTEQLTVEQLLRIVLPPANSWFNQGQLSALWQLIVLAQQSEDLVKLAKPQ